MATTTDPRAIHLALSVSGGGDTFGPFFAVLTLTRTKLEWLLKKADLFRLALEAEGLPHDGRELYQLTWFDRSPRFCEDDSAQRDDYDDDEDDDEDDEHSTDDLLERIFEDGDYPANDFTEMPPENVPEAGNVRLDYCKLVVANNYTPDRPGEVRFYWEAGIKHTDEEIATCEISEDRLRELLDRF